MKSTHLAGWGGILGLPWCCLVPAFLSALGLGAGLAAAVAGPVGWFFLLSSLALLVWANWLVWFRRQGAAPVRRLTVVLTIAAVALWLSRFWPYITWWG